MLYISTKVSRKWPRRTRQIKCSGTLPQPAPPQPGRSPALCWVDAYSLTLKQICKDLAISKTKLNTCMPQTPVQFLTNVLLPPESRPRKVATCLKQTRLKSEKATIKPIIGRINAPRLPNGRYQKLQSSALPGSSSAWPSPTSCSMAVAATWTSAPDATSTSLTTDSPSKTPSYSDLASLIYSTFILDHLKSNSTIELNLHKNLVCKFFYFPLISFLDNALYA